MSNDDEYNIYKELEYIKYNDLSRTGKKLKYIFNNVSIDTFLNKKKTNEIPFKRNNNYNYIDNKIIKDFSPIFDENYKSNKKNININIEKLRNWNKKYKIKPKKLDYLQKENNKSPPCGYYNPNYNSIIKHIPSIKLKPIKPMDKNKKKKLGRNILVNKRNLSKNDSDKTSDKEISDNSSIESKITSKSIDLNKKQKFFKNNIHGMFFDKYSSRKNFLIRTVYDFNLNPKLIEKNSSVPNFKLMSSRDKKIIVPKNESNYNYNPNYNSIYSGYSFHKKESKIFIKKKNLIRKIWRSFQTQKKYIVIHSLNDE